MSKIYYLFIFIFSFSVLSAQEKLSKEEIARRAKNVQAGNPFVKYGSKAPVATLSKGKYLEVHDLDSIVTIGTSRWHVDKKQIVGNIVQDSLNPDAQPIGDRAGRWMSPDPLSDEFPSTSPYVSFSNNPIRFTDPTGMAPDDVIITGAQSQQALQELQKSVQGQMNLSMDQNGKVSYTQVGNGALNSNSQQLANAINDHSVTVNVAAENTKLTAAGNLYIGGAFGGNTVTTSPNGNTVSTNQEINPTVLSTADNYYGSSGSLTLHEVTESYQGALISQASGISVGPATAADASNPNSVYNQAHNAATPQNMTINQNVYDASGNVLQQPYAGGVKVDFTVQQGNRQPQTIMTYP